MRALADLQFAGTRMMVRYPLEHSRTLASDASFGLTYVFLARIFLVYGDNRPVAAAPAWSLDNQAHQACMGLLIAIPPARSTAPSSGCRRRRCRAPLQGARADPHRRGGGWRFEPRADCRNTAPDQGADGGEPVRPGRPGLDQGRQPQRALYAQDQGLKLELARRGVAGRPGAELRQFGDVFRGAGRSERGVRTGAGRPDIYARVPPPPIVS